MGGHHPAAMVLSVEHVVLKCLLLNKIICKWTHTIPTRVVQESAFFLETRALFLFLVIALVQLTSASYLVSVVPFPSAPSPQMSDPVTPPEAAHPHLRWHQSPHSHLQGPCSDLLAGAVAASATPLCHITMLPRELPKILTWPLLLESLIGWA